MKVNFVLTGETPALIHRDNVEACDTLTAWRKDPGNKGISMPGDDRSPGWTWQTYLYTDGEKLVVPWENIMACIRKAATKMVFKRQASYKELSQSGLLIPTEFCQFLSHGKEVPLAPITAMRELSFAEQSDLTRELGFRLFVKRAAVGQTKHIRVRARFDDWAVRGTMIIQAKEITFDVLETMFGLAGQVGMFDWRPGSPKSPGPFGMFAARLAKV